MLEQTPGSMPWCFGHTVPQSDIVVPLVKVCLKRREDCDNITKRCTFNHRLNLKQKTPGLKQK